MFLEGRRRPENPEETHENYLNVQNPIDFQVDHVRSGSLRLSTIWSGKDFTLSRNCCSWKCKPYTQFRIEPKTQDLGNSIAPNYNFIQTARSLFFFPACGGMSYLIVIDSNSSSATFWTVIAQETHAGIFMLLCGLLIYIFIICKILDIFPSAQCSQKAAKWHNTAS